MSNVAKLPISGVITFVQDVCTGCGTCELVCSSRLEGISNPKLSCITIYYNPVEGEPTHDICNQCEYPPCVYACPGDAILVDEATGARYIDEEACVDCGLCYEACPYTPDRAMIKTRVEDEKEKYFKCDLCKDRPEGPMCVQYCPTRALIFVNASSRKRGDRGEKDTEQGKVADILSKNFFKPTSEQEKGG